MITCPDCEKDLREYLGAYLCADQIHCAGVFPIPDRFVRLEESS